MKYLLVVLLLFVCNVYALDLSRLDKSQKVVYIDGVPLITNENNGKSLYSNEKSIYYINFKSNRLDVLKVLAKYNPRMLKSVNVVSVNASENDLTDIVHALKKITGIEFINIAIKKHVHQIGNELLQYMPNDPLFQEQWYLYNNGKYDLKYLPYQEYIQNKKIDRSNIKTPVIAVVDEGFMLNTADLQNRFWINNSEIPNNGIDDDNNGYIDDYMGVDTNPDHSYCSSDLSSCATNFLQVNTFLHGYVLSSIIAATVNNKIAIAGLVPSNVKILPISAEDNSWREISYYLDAYDYILTMKKRGVNIIAVNESIGGYYDATEEKLLNELGKNGVLIIAAAGNDGMDIDKTPGPNYPAVLASKLNNVISVGSLNSSGKVSYFSSYGSKNVSIYVPGEDIVSPYYDGKETVILSSGTSQAAAVMSGIIGNAYWLYPDKSLINLKNAILRNSRSIYTYKTYRVNTIDLQSLINLKF
jgi:hypothetical protein